MTTMKANKMYGTLNYLHCTEHRKEKPPVKVDNKPSELDDEFHTGKFKT